MEHSIHKLTLTDQVRVLNEQSHRADNITNIIATEGSNLSPDLFVSLSMDLAEAEHTVKELMLILSN
jgi:hypothetical protein